MDFMDFVKKVLTIYFYTALYLGALFLSVAMIDFLEETFLPREMREAKHKTGCAGLYFEQEREMNASLNESMKEEGCIYGRKKTRQNN